jgi:predicted O-methyltransferase YrrM
MVEFIVPSKEENKILEQLENSYTKISEMTPDQRTFLNALVLRNKPKKLLEIGVSAGGSSVIILNAIKDFPGSKLYSIDLFEQWYKDNSRKTGYAVDAYPQLKTKWTLCTGALALHFMDKIGGDIDFCLIDTAHVNPGELFDVLMVLPYLKDGAVMVFHDVALHTYYFVEKKCEWGTKAITNCLLMSAITGLKYVQGNYMREGEKYFPNIAGVKIGKETKENIFEIYNLLLLKWSYLPTDNQEKEILAHFKRHYDEQYIQYLKDVFAYQRRIMVYDKRYMIKDLIEKIIGRKNIISIKKIIGKK